MGLLRWIRGDDNSTSTGMMSAGLAEIAGIFQPTRHKQTEHVEEASRRRLDLANGTGVDLDNGVAVIRRVKPDEPAVEPATD
ncbi:MAG TPA: hypothetical protein VF163_02435 [Micromonosporaceae bacterium]